MEPSAVCTPSLLSEETEFDSDFVEAAKQCEHLAASALEDEDLFKQQALYQRLHQCLSQLQPTLNDPIPQEMVAQFTVSTRPQTVPAMDTESDLLCEYCIALSELLSGNRLTFSIEQTLQGLLYELTCFLSDTMLAPRWLATPEGTEPL